MKKRGIFTSIILSIFLISSLIPLSIQVHATSLSPLHTDGMLIKDQNGNTLNFAGATESQTHWAMDTDDYWRHEADPIPMAERMEELEVPVVRIILNNKKWNDPVQGAAFRDLIDRYVEEFTSRGIYCMVGNMGNEFLPDAPDNPTPWINFLLELANRYKTNPGMAGIYIWNEVRIGQLGGFDIWYTWARLAADAINQANPNLLILIDADLSNRNGMDPYWVQNPITVPNAVYVFHDYFWQDYYYDQRDYALSYAAGDYILAKQQMEQSMYDRFFKYAVEYNMPIILEEFGFNGGQNPANKGWGNEPGWPQSQIDYMDLLAKYKIPWNQYNWAILTPDSYGLTENDFYTLSSVGEIWQQYLTP